MNKSQIKHFFGIEIRQPKRKTSMLSNDVTNVSYKHVCMFPLWLIISRFKYRYQVFFSVKAQHCILKL